MEIKSKVLVVFGGTLTLGRVTMKRVSPSQLLAVTCHMKYELILSLGSTWPQK